MKEIWVGRMSTTTAKVGEHAPMAAVCCNACRTCMTTNALAVAVAAGLGALHAVRRVARRTAR
jgi:hypothetical protein